MASPLKAANLTETQLRHMFDQYDTNHDGTISKDEVISALRRLELPATYAAEIFLRADKNGDGVLDFAEFVNYVHETEREFRQLFDLIDVEGKGSVTNQELGLALEKLHLHPTGEGVAHFAQFFHHESDGTIYYEDFVTTMCLLKPVDLLELYSHTSSMFGSSTTSMLSDLRVAFGSSQPRPLLNHTTRLQRREATPYDDLMRMGESVTRTPYAKHSHANPPPTLASHSLRSHPQPSGARPPSSPRSAASPSRQ